MEGQAVAIASSSSSSSDESSSSNSSEKRKKDRQAAIQAKMQQRDNAENAWMGWICPCGGKNLTMKARCTLCGQVKPLSAHQRGLGRAVQAIERARGKEESPKRGARGRSRSNKQTKRRRSRSRSSSSSSSSARSQRDKAKGGGDNEPEDVDDAKRNAIQRLQDIKAMQDGKEKTKAYRKLLREWHPDKNPDRVKVATEVFQFLQKASSLFKL
eukprot:TRINITY_DN45686_c0_g1_i1.p1 TRINITY_DN45686_c0_g1~~TRINITY_DN45686_c0_g1_i1.p1  ORF type:complete len:224 (+),score=35.76 TRINITY_DN45686_c0_g1_i1:34-672(+)